MARSLFRIGPLIVAVASLTSVAGAAQRPAAGELEAAMAHLGDSLVHGPVVGLSIAVTRGPEVILARGYGYSDLAAKTPATADTRYQIGSVTKQFTAAAVMRLVEQGKIALGDSITRYLPDFPTQGHDVTIYQLLTHTSGIRSYTSFLSLDSHYTTQAIYDSIKAQPFDFAPGTAWRYDNSGYFLLGLILQKVTGQPYAELLRDEFFRPLGLTHTGYCGADSTPIPGGYAVRQPGAGPVPVPPTDMRLPFAAGALCSTAPDLARWEWALGTGRVVRPSSYRQMSTEAHLKNGRPVHYGFALVPDSLAGHARVHHNGGIPGFVSELAWFPEDSTVVAVLINTESNATAVAERADRIALGLPLPVVRDLPTDSATRARFAGTYDLSAIGLKLRVFPLGDSLMGQATGQPAFRLLWQGDSVFVASFDPSVRLEFTVASGQATGVTLHQGGAIEGKRVGPE